MSLKSIVEVDVQDEKFREFEALFTKYQDALASTPDKWRKVKQGADEAASAWTKWDKQGRIVASGGYSPAAKSNLQDMARGRDLAQSTAFQWKGLAQHSRTFFTNIDGATKQIGKWSGVTGSSAQRSRCGLTGRIRRRTSVCEAGELPHRRVPVDLVRPVDHLGGALDIRQQRSRPCCKSSQSAMR